VPWPGSGVVARPNRKVNRTRQSATGRSDVEYAAYFPLGAGPAALHTQVHVPDRAVEDLLSETFRVTVRALHRVTSGCRPGHGGVASASAHHGVAPPADYTCGTTGVWFAGHRRNGQGNHPGRAMAPRIGHWGGGLPGNGTWDARYRGAGSGHTGPRPATRPELAGVVSDVRSTRAQRRWCCPVRPWVRGSASGMSAPARPPPWARES
jgi:hypothetical protein